MSSFKELCDALLKAEEERNVISEDHAIQEWVQRHEDTARNFMRDCSSALAAARTAISILQLAAERGVRTKSGSEKRVLEKDKEDGGKGSKMVKGENREDDGKENGGRGREKGKGNNMATEKWRERELVAENEKKDKGKEKGVDDASKENVEFSDWLWAELKEITKAYFAERKAHRQEILLHINWWRLGQEWKNLKKTPVMLLEPERTDVRYWCCHTLVNFGR